MGTRSNIAIKNDDGSYDLIYCHWDGYLDNNGVILFKNYREEEKVRNLIKHGSASSLKKRVDPIHPENHSYDDPDGETTVFYHRDRDEDWEDVSTQLGLTVKNETELRQEEYLYLWKDGEWWTCFYDHPMMKLLDALKNDEQSLKKIASFLEPDSKV